MFLPREFAPRHINDCICFDTVFMLVLPTPPPSFSTPVSATPSSRHSAHGCYSHRPVLAQQCQYFVVRRNTRVLPTFPPLSLSLSLTLSFSLSLSLSFSLCVLHYSRGNCSEFQSLVETRGRYSRSESGNARECRLNLRGRFVRRRGRVEGNARPP